MYNICNAEIGPGIWLFILKLCVTDPTKAGTSDIKYWTDTWEAAFALRVLCSKETRYLESERKRNISIPIWENGRQGTEILSSQCTAMQE